MLCDICHQREATVHLTEIVNDKVAKMHLCEQCARKKGEEMETQFGLSDLLAGLADFGTGGQQAKFKKSMKCNTCGFNLSDFERIGRLGCPKCYDAFSEQLSPLLRKIHGFDRHVGKMPIKKIKGKTDKEMTELRDLEAELQKAIATEAFEEAAALRDKIKEMRQKMKKDGES